MRKRTALILAAVCLAVGWLSHRPAPVVRYSRGEPRVEIRWRDRIVLKTVHPEQIATAPQAAVSTVRDFCAPSILTATRDTTAPEPEPRLLLEAVRHKGGDLEAWGPLSTGDLWRGSYRARGDFEARVDGDSLIVRTDRWDGAKRWGGRLLWLGAGAVLGAVAH